MRKVWLALLVLAVPYLGAPRAQQPPVLVVAGGTLIDGNGGSPVPDSVVVVQGNRITAVSRRGQTPIPAGARVFDAGSKFVLPGLWDSQVAYSWYFGEAMLNHGITSSIDVGTESETAVPHRDAVLHGKDLGPRAFTGIVRIGSTLNGATGFEMPLNTIRVPTSADDTRAVVRTVLGAGADYVIRVTLDAEALRTAGRFDLVMVNPAPVAPLYTKGMWGNGTSNQAHLIINYKY